MEEELTPSLNITNGIIFIIGILLTLYYINYHVLNKYISRVYNDIKLMFTNIISKIFL